MNSTLFIKNSTSSALALNLHENLNQIVQFIAEICDVKDVFVTLENKEGHVIQSKIGLEGVSNPNQILCFKNLIESKIPIMVSDVRTDVRFKTIDDIAAFNFFAGFTIPIDYTGLIAGTICILKKEPKILSTIELQIINQSVAQIKSLLQLHIENQELKDTINQNKKQFQLLTENSNEIFYNLDLQGNFTFITKNWTDLLGHSIEEILGSNFSPLIHPEDLNSCLLFLDGIAQKTSKSKQHTYRIKHKEGHYVWHCSIIGLLENNADSFYVGIARDITESAESQSKLLQQKEFYEKILDELPTDVAVFDNDFRYKYVNPAAIRNNELRQFIIGKNDFEYAKHTNRAETFAIIKRIKFEQAICNKQTIEWEDSIDGKNGETTHHIRKITPVFQKDGTLIMLIGFGVDITQNKKILDKLMLSNERFQGVFKYSGIGMAIINFANLKFEIVNDKVVEILGYSKKELKKLTFADITHPFDKANDVANVVLLNKGFISNYSTKKRYLHKNGSIVWVNICVSLVRNSSGEPIHFVKQIIDITATKKIEESNLVLLKENIKNKSLQLSEAQNLYRLLADNIVDLICVHHLDSVFEYVSPSIQAILGYLPEDLLGLSPFAFVHPEDHENLLKSIQHFIAEKKDVSVQARFRNKVGDYIWLETKGRLLKNKGIPQRFHSITRDITRGKEAEFVIEKMLIQERKLNELRVNLVSTISHEFRTPMTTIRANAELIMMYLEKQKIENLPLLQNKIDIVTGQIDRIVELMNKVLIISKEDVRKTNFLPIIFDLKQECLNVIKNSNFDHNEGRKVITTFDGDSFSVFADKNLMKYILSNLLNNAFKYSQGSGDVLLNVFITETKICVEIIDFGIGIPDEDQSKLFNTFFRASNTNGIEGSGLGLYIVKTFTERNSGSIKIESKLGEGTKAIVKFPLSKTEQNLPS